MKSEKDLQHYLQSQCFKHGMGFYKFSSPARRGVPDVVVIVPGGAVHFIELKSPTGKGRLHPLQVHEIEKIRALGCPAHVISNKDEVDGFITMLS